jgi:hypothetical protein
MPEQSPTNHGGRWLIWSNEHGAWWNPIWSGYTFDVAQAGRYSLSEAKKICGGAPGGCWLDNASGQHGKAGTPDELIVPSPELIASYSAALEAGIHEDAGASHAAAEQAVSRAD